MSLFKKLRLARRARKYGAHYAYRIIDEAEKADLPIGLAFALVQKECDFRNIFGGDPIAKSRNMGPAKYDFLRSIQGSNVTKSRFERYRSLRKEGWGMQGVGLTQLTWFSFQDEADSLGGCWKPRPQLRVGFALLVSLIDQFGEETGIARYNGSGPLAEAYSVDVLIKKARWNRRLFP